MAPNKKLFWLSDGDIAACRSVTTLKDKLWLALFILKNPSYWPTNARRSLRKPLFMSLNNHYALGLLIHLIEHLFICTRSVSLRVTTSLTRGGVTCTGTFNRIVEPLNKEGRAVPGHTARWSSNHFQHFRKLTADTA